MKTALLATVVLQSRLDKVLHPVLSFSEKDDRGRKTPTIQDVQELLKGFPTHFSSPANEKNPLKLVRLCSLFCFALRDIEALTHLKESVFGETSAVDDSPSDPSRAFLDFAQAALRRSLGHISLEAFEKELDRVDWTQFERHSIADLSTLTGWVYTTELGVEQTGKARLWLQKAQHESSAAARLLPDVLLANHYAHSTDSRAKGPLHQLQGVAADADDLNQTYNLVVKALVLFQSFQLDPDASQHLETYVGKAEELLEEREDWISSVNSRAAIFATAGTCYSLGFLYRAFYQTVTDQAERDQFVERIDKLYNDTKAYVDEAGAPAWTAELELWRSELAFDTNSSVGEKQLKETASYYRKKDDYPRYAEIVYAHARLMVRDGQATKAMDLLGKLFRTGHKQLETNGTYLLTKALGIGVDLMLPEMESAGISWIVGQLEPFFHKMQEMLTLDEEIWLDAGKTQLETMRVAFLRSEPLSHFNIHAYYLYQYLTPRVLQLGALAHGDEICAQLAEKFFADMSNPTNPLSFVSGWDDFKDVPNFVRNMTLNKCITITKGDLPLASEHLDFSYRNLRSYITFKEVNRLGNFLELQQTQNWQLEQGIRLMFYDLYKQGKIFEVVFDMPKFLVESAREGFYAKDLENALSIKGTTAKKYIKIMIQQDMIRQDKTIGRKHFYRLNRENAMKRLGVEQAAALKSENGKA